MKETSGASTVAPGQVKYWGSAGPGSTIAVDGSDAAAEADDGDEEAAEDGEVRAPDEDDVPALGVPPVEADADGVAASGEAAVVVGGAVSDGLPAALLDTDASTEAGRSAASSSVSVMPAVTSRAAAAPALAVTAQRAARPPSA